MDCGANWSSFLLSRQKNWNDCAMQPNKTRDGPFSIVIFSCHDSDLWRLQLLFYLWPFFVFLFLLLLLQLAHKLILSTSVIFQPPLKKKKLYSNLSANTTRPFRCSAITARLCSLPSAASKWYQFSSWRWLNQLNLVWLSLYLPPYVAWLDW